MSNRPARPKPDERTGAPVHVYIGLGSNLGDRAGRLASARRELASAGRTLSVSSVYETEPWGVDHDDPPYLNQVCEILTELKPTRLMNRLLAIEEMLGRRRKRRGEPRIIDLDLLLYGDRVIDTPGLKVPHPRMAERAFVLVPLAEVAPDVVHPVRGATPGDLLRGVDASGVKKWDG